MDFDKEPDSAEEARAGSDEDAGAAKVAALS